MTQDEIKKVVCKIMDKFLFVTYLSREEVEEFGNIILDELMVSFYEKN